MKTSIAAAVLAALWGFGTATAWADGVDTFKGFIREVKTGSADFTQTVTSSDGAKKKVSSGNFSFSRPNRFRFGYLKPFEQTIVADGQKVWIYDADLNQVSARKISAALGATPAALLAGNNLDGDFDLAALPARDGLDWVRATPKAADSAFKSLQVGFRGKDLASVEIVDAFGQRSLLQFSRFVANPTLPTDSFRFVVPAGADVIEQ